MHACRRPEADMPTYESVPRESKCPTSANSFYFFSAGFFQHRSQRAKWHDLSVVVFLLATRPSSFCWHMALLPTVRASALVGKGSVELALTACRCWGGENLVTGKQLLPLKLSLSGQLQQCM